LDFVLHAILPNHFGSAMSDIIGRRQLICAGATFATLALGQWVFAEEGLAAQPDIEDHTRLSQRTGASRSSMSDFRGRNS
jgi:hypothetical protein